MTDRSPFGQEVETMPGEVRGAIAATLVLAALGALGAALIPSLRGATRRGAGAPQARPPDNP